MADQRQPFRFRLPWLSTMSAPPPRPTPEPQPSRPTPEIQAPAQPTITTPIQRPPFRPAGIAPAQPPPQAQTTIKREPQPPPPSGAATESRVASQPTSPPRATTQTRAASVPPPESRVTSQPASPSRARTQTPVASQIRSPSRPAPQARAASVPPSPPRTAWTQPGIQAAAEPRLPSHLGPQSTGQTSSRSPSPMGKATKVRPTAGAVSQLPSPQKQSEPSTKETSQPPLNITHPLSSYSEEKETKESSQPPLTSTHPLSSLSPERESKPAASKQLLQEPQPKTQIKSEIDSESQYRTGGETTFKPDTTAAQTTQASDLGTTIPPTSSVTPEAPLAREKLPLTESEKKIEGVERKKDMQQLVNEAKPQDGKEVARELVKDEKTNGSADEQMPRTISELLTAASGLETRSKELFGAKIKTEERKQEKHEIFERKKPQSTPESEEKHIKTVSSTHAKDRNIIGNHQKPGVSNGDRTPLHKEIKEDISKFVHKLAIGHSKQPVDDRPVSIITVAGENRGASMQLGAESAKKGGSVPIHRGYKLKSDEIAETTTDGEESSKGRSPRDPTTKNNQATTAYINSNIQSINNSIMFNSSVNERNPGVHLVFSHNLAEPTKPATKPETLETHGHEAKVTITPSEKLTYQPTVRRRCLRGLFLEPSDSDPDNPEKPRRHGCLYKCGEKSKDKDIRVL